MTKSPPRRGTNRQTYHLSRHWRRLRTKILNRDERTCRYCDGHATQADHVLARSLGGADHESNLVASCRWCNGVAGGEWFADVEDKRQWLQRRRREFRSMDRCDLTRDQRVSLTRGTAYPFSMDRAFERAQAVIAADVQPTGHRDHYRGRAAGSYHNSRAGKMARERRRKRMEYR